MLFKMSQMPRRPGLKSINTNHFMTFCKEEVNQIRSQETGGLCIQGVSAALTTQEVDAYSGDEDPQFQLLYLSHSVLLK